MEDDLTHDEFTARLEAHRRETAQEREDRQRRLLQRSGAEVPGFHLRTVIDDTIAKLYAIRTQIRTDIPEGADALLDDIEAMVERAVDLVFDPDADAVYDDVPTEAEDWRERSLTTSGSKCISHCSCGGLSIHQPE